MELAFYLRVLRRWFWLIIVNTVVFGSLSFVYNRSLPPVYEASTTVLIGAIFTNLDPNSGVFSAGQQLAPNYVAFAKAYPILQSTIENLQLSITPESLSQMFTARIIPNTLMLQITVTYGDPVLVADIANELTTQLIAESPTNLTEQQQQQTQTLQEEIASVENQLKDLRAQLANLDNQLKTSLTEEQRQQIDSVRREVGSQINSAQTSLAQMTSSLTTLQGQNNTNVLTIVERARIPTAPVSRNILFSTLASALLGGILAAGLGVLIEYLSDAIRVPGDLPVGVTLLGTIAPFGRKGSYSNKLVVLTQPRSAIAEAYRALRVSLTHAAVVEDGDAHFTYIVTSPGPGEGKSTTIANLAITFANAGLRVVLIDADLRRPVQHTIFGLPTNTIGLSNVLTSSRIGTVQAAFSKSQSTAESEFDYEKKAVYTLITSVIQKTQVAGLDIISSGPTPENPAELLGTVQMQGLIRILHHDLDYNVILIDTPPILSVSDTSILANVIDAYAALVVEAGRTRRGATIRAINQLTNLSVKVAGIVLNFINLRDADASYGYYYGYYGYESRDQFAQNPTLGSNGQRPIPAIPTNSQTKRPAPRETEE